MCPDPRTSTSLNKRGELAADAGGEVFGRCSRNGCEGTPEEER